MQHPKDPVEDFLEKMLITCIVIFLLCSLYFLWQFLYFFYLIVAAFI